MKKIITIFLALVLALALVACGGGGDKDGADGNGDYKVAMITDYGDITDQSFNQPRLIQLFDKATGNNLVWYDKQSADACAPVCKAYNE